MSEAPSLLIATHDLALVRKAMERMGGRAWAESAVGKGATFYLEIRGVEKSSRQ